MVPTGGNNSQDQGGMGVAKGIGIGLGIEAGMTLAEQGLLFGAGGAAAKGLGWMQGYRTPQFATKTSVIGHLGHGTFRAGHGSAKGIIANYGLELGTAALGGVGLSMLASNKPHNKINSNEDVGKQIGMGALGGGIMGGAFVGAKLVAGMKYGPQVIQSIAKSKGLEDYLTNRREEIQNSTTMSAEKKKTALDQVERYQSMRERAMNTKEGAINVAAETRNGLFGNNKYTNKAFNATDKAMSKFYHMKGRSAVAMGGSILAGALAGAGYKAANN